MIAGLLGVVDAGGGTYEAVVALPGAGAPLSGGVHSSAAEAARAHDAVARMYLGDGACTNFEARASAAWAPEPLAGAGGASQVVSVRTGVRLSVDEVLALLNANAGVDVRPLDLAGKNDIAAFMVFATGRTPGHMRRLADSVAEAAAARAPYPGVPEVGVEDREGDWWMLVDLGDIIVNVFDAVARKAFDIEGWCAAARRAGSLRACVCAPMRVRVRTCGSAAAGLRGLPARAQVLRHETRGGPAGEPRVVRGVAGGEPDPTGVDRAPGGG